MPRHRWLNLGLGGLGAAPLAAYLVLVAIGPAVSPEAARAALSASPEARLVDVSPARDFARRHVTAALHLDPAALGRAQSRDELPPWLHGRRLFVTGADTVECRLATARLRRLGLDAVAVDGGNTQWAVAEKTAPPPRPDLETWTLADGRREAAPARDASTAAVIALLAAGFLLKPTYMLLVLALIFVLRRRSSHETDLLRSAMSFFLGGEVLCAVNMIAFTDRSWMLEYGHIAGMIAAAALAIEAGLCFAEQRIVRPDPSDPRCLLASSCGRCTRLDGVRCRMHVAWGWLVVLVSCLTPMPMLMSLVPTSYTAHALGQPVPFQQPWLLQWTEARLLPATALVLLATGAGLAFSMLEDRRATGRRLASFGLGCLGFSFFRLALFTFYRDTLWWAGFWEEATEWLAIAALALLLSLFPGSSPARRLPA